MTTAHVPEVLFVCVHNAGRSQMAAALLERLGGDRVRVRSAGTDPSEVVNPVVAAAMAEIGIDLSRRAPTRLSSAHVDGADVVVTMGCGDVCPVVTGTRYLDWELDDPSGRPLEEVRAIRDQIERRVRLLVAELDIAAQAAAGG